MREGAGLRDPGEFLRGEHSLDGHLEILSDLEREVQTGAVLSALEVANCLVMHTECFGQIPAGDLSLDAQHRNAVMNSVCHAVLHSPLFLDLTPAFRDRKSVV